MTRQNRHIVIFLILANFAIFQSCELPPPPDQAGGTPSSNSQPTHPSAGEVVEGLQAISEDVAELARPNKVQAWVDKLIVKAQPGKDMPQVATMEEGEMATYLYQRTVRKESFNLRGQQFNEAWILINTQNGVMGWVHEGGVRFVNPALEQSIQDLLGPPPSSGRRMAQAPVIPPASHR